MKREVRGHEKASVAVTMTPALEVYGEQARGPRTPFNARTVADTKDHPAPNASRAPLGNTGHVLKITRAREGTHKILPYLREGKR